MNINFENFQYYPKIRTRVSEIKGLVELKRTTRNNILPLLSLVRRGEDETLEHGIDKVCKASIITTDNPVIIEFETNSIRAFSDIKLYLNPKMWLKLFQKMEANIPNSIIPTAIPASFINSPADYLQHLHNLESNFDAIAIVINPLNIRSIRAGEIAAKNLSNIEKVLFIIDTGQIDNPSVNIIANTVIETINKLRRIAPNASIVFIGTSFPSSFVSYGREAGSIPILEQKIYSLIGGEDVCFYGDYASIHGEFYIGSFANFVARVDYPIAGSWIFERKPGQSKNRGVAYATAAKSITQNIFWDSSLDCWGSQMIEKVANGYTDSMKAPGKWISVRLNLHIERTLLFLKSNSIGNNVIEEEDDDFDDLNW